ncbi:hypothetical protein MTR67_008391 [Solanum verrucosum]|uniref:TF-B3 domain-containing protein n=1 Tax=Solanum verrucosum TaxID=315347 RepID=A0AAF0TDJ9_SOLVR|nr:hypothetical protein MTR67_008391 [Solanum verrucosum]
MLSSGWKEFVPENNLKIGSNINCNDSVDGSLEIGIDVDEQHLSLSLLHLQQILFLLIFFCSLPVLDFS